METVIIVIHLMLVVVLIGVVLIQKSEGGGLGIGGGGGGGFMSSRGTANLLTRTTAIVAGLFFLTSLLVSWLADAEGPPTAPLLPTPTAIVAGLFFVPSLLLSWLANYERRPASIINNTSAPLSQPATPVAPTGGGVLDSLKQQEQQAPSVPQPPRSQ